MWKYSPIYLWYIHEIKVLIYLWLHRYFHSYLQDTNSIKYIKINDDDDDDGDDDDDNTPLVKYMTFSK